ncbi:uncharacterized protein [Haliotis cracherodii]|uniref:uncharacterized protein n=1 Tax=Haliotis cracherodii TaxID=6455 RepID=UPI0039EB0C9A
MLKFSGIGIALLGLVLAIDGQMGVSDPRCDEMPDGKGNVMANGKSCKEFLQCWDYLIYGPMPCAGGTMFNSTTGDCDATECIEGRSGTPDGCASTGSLPEDCSQFITCANGLEYQYQCGEGTYYSNDLLVCVHPKEYPDIPEKQGCEYMAQQPQ